MNSKREALRKTLSFISALSFLSSTSGYSLTSAAVASDEKSISSEISEKIVTNNNIANVVATSISAKKAASDVTTTEVSRNTSATTSKTQSITSPTTVPITTSKENTSETTTATSSDTTTTTSTTTTTTTTTATMQFTIDNSPTETAAVNQLKNQIANLIRNALNDKAIIAEVQSNENSDKDVTIFYNPDDSEKVLSIFETFKDINIDALENNKMYRCYYIAENKNFFCDKYYIVNNSSNTVLNYNFPEASLASKNGNTYVKNGTTLDTSMFSLENGYKFAGDDNTVFDVNGRVEINNSEIKIRDKKVIDIVKCKVDIVFNCQNVEITIEKYSDSKEKHVFKNGSSTFNIEWVDLTSYKIDIKAKDAKNLIINNKIYNTTSYNNNISEFLKYIEIINNDTEYIDGAELAVEVIGAPETIQATRTLGKESKAENINFELDSENKIKIPYVIVNGDNVYYLQNLSTNKQNKNYTYQSIVDIMKNQNLSSEKLTYSSDFFKFDDNNPIRLNYELVTDTDDNIRNEILELFVDDEQETNRAIINDILYIKQSIQYKTLLSEKYANNMFSVVYGDGYTNTIDIDSNGAMSFVHLNNNILQFILLNDVIDLNTYAPQSMTPFLVYLDGYKPDTVITNTNQASDNEPFKEWTNDTFKFDFTLNDIDEDLVCSAPSLAEDVEKLQADTHLSSVKSITIAGHTFNKPAEGWNNVSLLENASEVDVNGEKYNVTLVVNKVEIENDNDSETTNEDEKKYTISFTANISLKDTAILGVDEEIKVFAVDVAGNIGDAATAQVKIDRGAPNVESISAEAVGKYGVIPKNTNLFVEAEVNDVHTYKYTTTETTDSDGTKVEIEKTSNYPSSGIDKIVYNYGDIKKESKTALFELNGKNINSPISVTVYDKAGNETTYYYKQNAVNNIISNNKQATNVITDNNKPSALIDAESLTVNYQDGDKKWFNDYPKLKFEVKDEEPKGNAGLSTTSGIVALRFNINGVSVTLGENELTLVNDATAENKYPTINDAAADFIENAYVEFIPDTKDAAQKFFIPHLKSSVYKYVDIPLVDEAILLNNGELAFKLVSIDRAGNESDTSQFTFYVDNNKPTVDGIFYKSDESDNSVYMYKYGTFANHAINIKVPISDSNQGASSGYKSSKLCFLNKDGTGSYFESTEIKNDYAYFTIPNPKDIGENFIFEGSMKIQVTDNVGNVSDAALLSSDEPNNSYLVIVENIEPIVPTPTLTGDNQYIKENDDGEIEHWFSGDVEVKYDVSDSDSGIAFVEKKSIYRNGLSEESKDYMKESEQTKDDAHIFYTESDVDGKFDFNINVTDNAGNIKTESFSVYKDVQAPYVASISFEKLVNNKDDVLLESENSDKYSHFHNDNYRARITVKDDRGASSGIQYIYCQLYNPDGTLYGNEYKLGKDEISLLEDNVSYVAEFDIPEGFKGDIKAWAVDNVNYKSSVFSPNGYVSENEERHNKADYEHIVITLPSTDKRDHDDNLLYNNDVEAEINVTDTHSGIKTVSWRTSDNQDWKEIRINHDGNIEGDAESWSVIKKDRNIVQSLKRNISVTTDANADFIEVKMQDNSENPSTIISKFSIDKQKPIISVTGIDSSEGIKYYNTHKTVHVAIAERNFDNPTINGVTDSGFTDDNTTERNTDQFRHTKDLEFNVDGDYSIVINNTDLAGNVADEYNSGPFVIDTVAPKASIAIEKPDGTVVSNGRNTYIDSSVRAVININELNFDPNSVNITVNDSVFTPSSWSGSSDHSTVIPTDYFKDDGIYTVKVSGNDLAGNSMNSVSVSFTIDQKKPIIKISGVSEANRGDVTPEVNVTDINLDKCDVALYRNGVELKCTTDNNGQSVKYALDNNGNYITAEWIVINDKNGISRKLVFNNFDKAEIYDGSYVIKVKTSDMAENTSTDSFMFSVNRYGSVFILGDADNINRNYLNKAPVIVITERNVDKHSEKDELIVIVDKGSNTVELSKSQYTVSNPIPLDDKSGYEYTYTIQPEIFDQDLDYNVSIQSVDAAGNKNVSSNRGAEISFTIDTHNPEFKCDDLINMAEFKQSEKEFRININEKIKHITVKTSDGDVLLDNESVDGENSYVFVIPAANASRDIVVELTDLAGNITTQTYKNLLVTENIFLFMLHKTWVKVAGGSILALLGALGGSIFVRKRKKNR